ncbi:hypothetical protein QCA50_000420 [Cerrena zonata]|uniref:Long chronological lifespan protein 2 n=1 Tax=Cerrena zonata TaxID=2478898 RepID=A0AAW0GQU2_9APHY
MLNIFISLVFLPLALAQFQFFEQMFGQQHPGQQPRQQQTGYPGQWAAHAEAVPCSDYLCPGTLTCVQNPSQCPCPDAQDIPCLVPDAQDKDGATVLCVRGSQDCSDVQRLASRYSK